MAEFPPVRVLYDGADTVGLSEFQEFEFIAVSSGGTGASSVTDVAASLNILSSLSGLGDTDIAGTPTVGQVLTWDIIDGDWTPSTNPAGVTTLSALSDTTIEDSPTNAVSLVWSAVPEVWVASALDHTQNIANIGTHNHTSIDNHIDSASIHFTEVSINHNAIGALGGNDHPQYVLSATNLTLSTSVTDHAASVSVHFAEDTIDHTQLLNIGDDSHATIDAHIDDVGIHFTIASANVSSLNDVDASTSPVVGAALLWSATVEQWVASTIDHLTNIDNVGTNTHAAIDTHLADSTVHFTEGSIQKKAGITFETPVDADLLPIFATNRAITITEIIHACVGDTSVAWTLVHGASPSSTTNTVETGTAVITLTSDDSMSGDATVPADSYINLDIGTVTGSPTIMTMTVFYTED